MENITLPADDSILIQTPTGTVMISTFVGMSVAVFDAPDDSPVSVTNLKPKEN